MLQNKIYQNFLIEIIKTFLVILFGLSIIALTVRAVNFLELIVDSGYPPSTYFKYSFLNLLSYQEYAKKQTLFETIVLKNVNEYLPLV